MVDTNAHFSQLPWLRDMENHIQAAARVSVLPTLDELIKCATPEKYHSYLEKIEQVNGEQIIRVQQYFTTIEISTQHQEGTAPWTIVVSPHERQFKMELFRGKYLGIFGKNDETIGVLVEPHSLRIGHSFEAPQEFVEQIAYRGKRYYSELPVHFGSVTAKPYKPETTKP